MRDCHRAWAPRSSTVPVDARRDAGTVDEGELLERLRALLLIEGGFTVDLHTARSGAARAGRVCRPHADRCGSAWPSGATGGCSAGYATAAGSSGNEAGRDLYLGGWHAAEQRPRLPRRRPGGAGRPTARGRERWAGCTASTRSSISLAAPSCPWGPPDAHRRHRRHGPPRRRRGSTADPRRGERVASILGIALGVSFTVCFATGLYSHLAQHPPSWFTLPARPGGSLPGDPGPARGDRHRRRPAAAGQAVVGLPEALPVATGALVWPTASSASASSRWSPAACSCCSAAWPTSISGTRCRCSSPPGHYWVAWLTMGALIVHIGAKATVARHALARSAPGSVTAETRHDRRRFLLAVGATSGLLTLVTVGETVRPLRRLALLAPRDPDVGTQGFPVNNAAREAGVVDAATDPAWRLRVTGAVDRPLALSRAQLQALPQREATLPIACVEGWSASRRWRGVSLPVLLALAGRRERRVGHGTLARSGPLRPVRPRR